MHGYPTPDPTATSRSRRSGQRSEESESARPFGISNVLHRVGAPPLRPLPLETFYHSDVLTLNRMFGEVIYNTVRAILTDNGVPVDEDEEDDKASCDIVSRCEPDNEDSAETTILIVAPWGTNSPEVWQKCVREIKRWVDSYLDENGMEAFDVSVEMAATELVQKKYNAPVLDRPDLDKDWEDIKANIRGILGSFDTTKGQWDCIALFRFGPNEDPEKNPPTVYISLDRECPEVTWSPVRNSIQSYLDNTPYGLNLHIEHSYHGQYIGFEMDDGKTVPDPASPLVIEAEYTQKVGLGADVGAGRYLISKEGKRLNPSFGTLGCYVELRLKGGLEWTKFALTNYHVVRPAIEGFIRPEGTTVFSPDPQSHLYASDHNGFMPDNAIDSGIESPSRVKHNNTIRFLNAAIQAPDDFFDETEMIESRDQKIAFFEQNKHPLGTLWAGSGFNRRSADNGMLDWALIKVEESRIGRNTLPDKGAWPKSMWTHVPPKKIQGAQLGRLAPAHDITVRQKVFKLGASTQGTTAEYSKHKADVVYRDWKYMFLENHRHTRETAFTSIANHFKVASGGDSGSIVYGGNGRALGMLFRGSSSSSFDHTGSSHAYVTPLEYIFKDIKDFLYPMVIDVRVAQF